MELRTNHLKQKLAAGEVVLAVTGLYDTDEIDALAPMLLKSGISALWFDGEHGPTTHHELGNLTRVCDLWGLTSMIRIGSNDQNLIFRSFDRGAQAVVVPHVSSGAEARNLVDGGKFPPIGHRGSYLGRQGYGVPDYIQNANDATALVAMVENTDGVKNLDEILAVDHIDMFFIGVWDLAGDMGYLADRTNATVKRQVFELIERITAAGRTAGVVAFGDEAADYIQAGAKFIMTSFQSIAATGAKQFADKALKGR